MAEIVKNPPQLQPVALPEAEILLFGRGRVNFAWNFTRKAPFWFLYCNPEPGACLEFSGRRICPGAGEIILIPPGTPFRSSCLQPFEHLYIHFTAGRPYSQVKPEVIIMDSSVAGTLLDRIFQDDAPPATAVYGLLFSVLAAIPESCFTAEDREFDDRIQRAMGMINRGASNMKMCTAVGMSISNFQRRFKQETGISPRRYAMQLRLEKARCALAYSDDEISVIAENCGFADRYAFSKAFKKYTGVSPAKYRMQNKS